MGRQNRVEAPEDFCLEVLPLGPVLLHEVGARNRLLQVRVEVQAVLRGTGSEAEPLQGRPVLRHAGAQPVFRAGRRIGGRNVEAVGQEMRGPARADHAGGDDGNTLDDGRVHGRGSRFDGGRERIEEAAYCSMADRGRTVVCTTIGPRETTSPVAPPRRPCRSEP